MSEFLFPDYMVILAGTLRNLQHNISVMNKELKKINVRIITNKTKMDVSAKEKIDNITLEGKCI